MHLHFIYHPALLYSFYSDSLPPYLFLKLRSIWYKTPSKSTVNISVQSLSLSLTMFFLRLTIFASTLVSLVTATPAPRAEASSIEGVLQGLKSTTDAILPQINALVANKTATEASVSPLLNQVVSAVNAATLSVTSLQVGGVVVKRDSNGDVAALAASIMTDINTTTQGLTTSGLGLGSLVTVIGVALSQLLVTLEVIVPGLLALVVALLDGVVGTLVSLLSGLLGVILG
ncbi:uncharacterized protein BT62DRAFT_303991 [Guyanagaster necrorhizus]|uniref:Uncharacterized protein n=1 Tax=Guyanagaster necrorhizus TaxID=856835 RepID=A0A9P8AQA5_9AGAR|nr:uncharacterized protein BT62DRAFT_303991 [Guyanagaster necrorhizus MCA 3950]KAG7443899.1 hypothetical protein BT62DRAFT_303991 [Guyanagaster necrorhizus MCA 3950]